MESKAELQIINCDRKAGMILLESVGAKPICSFCGDKISKRNFGGIFSKPTRVCCDNICCLIEAIPDENNFIIESISISKGRSIFHSGTVTRKFNEISEKQLNEYLKYLEEQRKHCQGALFIKEENGTT